MNSSPSRPNPASILRYSSLLAIALIAILAMAGPSSAAPQVSTDLGITMTASTAQVQAGSSLTYSIQVRNLGPSPATGTTVTDSLPKGLDLTSAKASAGTCAQKGQRVICDLGTIAVGGAPATVTITAVARDAGTITNSASVKSDQKDPVGANDVASVTTKVLAPPATATCNGVAATVVGTTGSDELTGTGGRDVIAAFGGNDRISSFAGNDLICAGNGDDYVAAGSAADRVIASGGRDRLIGQGGPDLLGAGAGNDVLKGGAGADRLRGGSGSDRCRGGAGRDSVRSCEA